MRIFGEATESILRLPGFLRVAPARTEMVRTSTGQLDTVLNQAEDVMVKARDLVAGRSQSDLTTSLESTSWSVAQCLDHLAQTTNAFVPAISSAIARAPRLTTNRALSTGTLARLFILNLEPPYRLRFKVLTSLVPNRRDFNAAWNAFPESQAELERTIRSARGLAIDRVRVESPVYARFSYNVYGALRMLTAHQRRHLWQIEQILRTLDGTHVRNVS
jgi:DinB superfamily